jgi:PadR family transcriptional regulator, regulatory protein AphA
VFATVTHELAVEKSVAYLWTSPHSQLYRAADRLTSFRLLPVRREWKGRRHKACVLTERGTAALEEWFSTPAQDVFELRDEAVLQLFFSDHMSSSQLVQLSRQEASQYELRLKTYADSAAVELLRHG